jgi:hypothetical protein
MDHPEIMGNLLTHSYQIMLADSNVAKAVKQYQATHKLPAFCQIPKATGFIFPVIS